MTILNFGEVSNISIIIILSGFVVFITTIVVLAFGFASKCPGCKKWWKRVRVHKEFLREEPKCKRETVRDPAYDRDGNPNGYVERKNDVLYKRKHYLIYYKCQNCGHCWSQPIFHDIRA